MVVVRLHHLHCSPRTDAVVANAADHYGAHAVSAEPVLGLLPAEMLLVELLPAELLPAEPLPAELLPVGLLLPELLPLELAWLLPLLAGPVPEPLLFELLPDVVLPAALRPFWLPAPLHPPAFQHLLPPVPLYVLPPGPSAARSSARLPAASRLISAPRSLASLSLHH